MSSSTDLISTKKRLTEWGNWCCKIITMGLGYSSQSLIAKLQSEGGIIIKGTAKMLLPSNEQAEEVNDLIERLAREQPEGEGKSVWAKVIRIHYTMRDKEMKERVQIASVSERSYYRHLQDAQYWLSNYLSDC